MAGEKSKQLALAEREMLKAIMILQMEHERMEETVNELVEAVNSLGERTELEWNPTDKKWLKLQ